MGAADLRPMRSTQLTQLVANDTHRDGTGIRRAPSGVRQHGRPHVDRRRHRRRGLPEPASRLALIATTMATLGAGPGWPSPTPYIRAGYYEQDARTVPVGSQRRWDIRASVNVVGAIAFPVAKRRACRDARSQFSEQRYLQSGRCVLTKPGITVKGASS
jgi:hypothetical protein